MQRQFRWLVFSQVNLTHECYIFFYYFVRISHRSVRYWNETCDALVPIFSDLLRIGSNISNSEISGDICGSTKLTILTFKVHVAGAIVWPILFSPYCFHSSKETLVLF